MAAPTNGATDDLPEGLEALCRLGLCKRFKAALLVPPLGQSLSAWPAWPQGHPMTHAPLLDRKLGKLLGSEFEGYVSHSTSNLTLSSTLLST